jgi:hypothetical protein
MVDWLTRPWRRRRVVHSWRDRRAVALDHRSATIWVVAGAACVVCLLIISKAGNVTHATGPKPTDAQVLAFAGIAIAATAMVIMSLICGFRLGLPVVRHVTSETPAAAVLPGDWIELHAGDNWPATELPPGAIPPRRRDQLVRVQHLQKSSSESGLFLVLSDSSAIPAIEDLKVRRVSEMEPHDRWMLATSCF